MSIELNVNVVFTFGQYSFHSHTIHVHMTVHTSIRDFKEKRKSFLSILEKQFTSRTSIPVSQGLRF